MSKENEMADAAWSVGIDRARPVGGKPPAIIASHIAVAAAQIVLEDEFAERLAAQSARAIAGVVAGWDKKKRDTLRILLDMLENEGS